MWLRHLFEGGLNAKSASVWRSRTSSRNKERIMKFRLVILTFVLSMPPFLLNPTIASSRDAESHGSCFPGTYLVVEGSGTQSLWTLSQDGAFQVTSSAERAFGFSHIQGVWTKTGARDAKARGLDFNFNPTPVNGGAPPSQIASYTRTAMACTSSGIRRPPAESWILGMFRATAITASTRQTARCRSRTACSKA